jgi:hypothetical protein
VRPDIVTGGVFPHHELRDHTNAMRSLSEIQGEVTHRL